MNKTKPKVRKVKDYPRIYIEWADATAPMEGWQTIESVLEWAEHDDYWVEQVGWVLKETSRYLLLASQRSVTQSNGRQDHFTHITKIPKTWVRTRKDI